VPGEPGVKEKVRTATEKQTARPKRYRVLLFNDDYTTMEFVVLILEQVFRRGPVEAHAIMMAVHTKGQAEAGVYPYEVAEAKILTTHELARSAGYPLRCGMEEV
jgi:ATP-dependent Clp protease adaptor protein ClpS